MKINTALILCAGFGKRVNPITTNIPKPLITYKNITLLENTINFLIDLTESNYLDYYTGTKFTFYAKNVRGEVARGGRYISKEDSNLESSTGFTCYMDTVLRASSYKEQLCSSKVIIDSLFLSSKRAPT